MRARSGFFLGDWVCISAALGHFYGYWGGSIMKMYI